MQPFEFLARSWRSYRARHGMARELTTFALALLFGLVLVPLAIFACGQLLLGPYLTGPAPAPAGGAFTLWSDFMRGLGSGSPGYWIIALGPYVSYLVLRWLRRF